MGTISGYDGVPRHVSEVPNEIGCHCLDDVPFLVELSKLGSRAQPTSKVRIPTMDAAPSEGHAAWSRGFEPHQINTDITDTLCDIGISAHKLVSSFKNCENFRCTSDDATF